METLVAGSERTDAGWVIVGTGVAFSNYGHGEPGEITNQVMLGVEAGMSNGIVKIVQPDTAKQDKGKLTAIGRDDDDRIVLLRQGWLKKNAISDEVRRDFAELSGLEPVPVLAGGKRSPREWYIVADLGGKPSAIINATVRFASACATSRSKTGKRNAEVETPGAGYALGIDETGGLIEVEIDGGSREVERLHGFVWEALKRELGDRLIKPTRSGYEVDGYIEASNVLIEIKTGVAAHDIHGAVGQLALYPHLVSLPSDLTKVLLLPGRPPLRPAMAAAICANSVSIHYYDVRRTGKKLAIDFSVGFLATCRRES